MSIKKKKKTMHLSIYIIFWIFGYNIIWTMFEKTYFKFAILSYKPILFEQRKQKI